MKIVCEGVELKMSYIAVLFITGVYFLRYEMNVVSFADLGFEVAGAKLGGLPAPDKGDDDDVAGTAAVPGAPAARGEALLVCLCTGDTPVDIPRGGHWNCNWVGCCVRRAPIIVVIICCCISWIFICCANICCICVSWCWLHAWIIC